MTALPTAARASKPSTNSDRILQRPPRIGVEEGRPLPRREQALVFGSGVDRQHLGGLWPIGHAAASSPLVTAVAVAVAVVVAVMVAFGGGQSAASVGRCSSDRLNRQCGLGGPARLRRPAAAPAPLWLRFRHSNLLVVPAKNATAEIPPFGRRGRDRPAGPGGTPSIQRSDGRGTGLHSVATSGRRPARPSRSPPRCPP